MLKIGILGAGAAAATIHAPGIQANSQAELAAIASRTPAHAAQFATQLSIPQVYTSYPELLRDPQIDAVVICTPPHQHRALAEMAVENSKHVLIEKPIAAKLADVAALKKIAKEGTLIVDVVRNQRFQDLYRRVKERLQSGIIGEPNFIFITSTTSGPEHWNPAGTWLRDAALAGGGALIDLGVHKVDLAAWILEQVPTRISPAVLDRRPVEDIGWIHLQLGEVMASILASWKGPDEGSQVLVFGSAGSLRAFGSSGEVEIRLADKVLREQVSIPWSAQDLSAEKMIADFIERCLVGQRFSEKELELWDTGTRVVLESYQQAAAVDRSSRTEDVNDREV
jgi:myo-inositol 2-dehydrogenase/D-chiro-inositol 1-dehydrogenase